METETLNKIKIEIDYARWDIDEFIEQRMTRLEVKIREIDLEETRIMLDNLAKEAKEADGLVIK